MPAALIRRGVEDVGVRRVDDDVGDAGVLADGEHRLPRLPAVSRLVKSAIAARRPKRPLRRNVDDIGVARIDDDLRDVLGLFQPDVLPALPAVDRFVNPVPHRHRALAVVLPRPNPDHERVMRIDRHAADGERLLIIEQRREADPRIRRLPNPASRGGDVPDPPIFRTARSMMRPEVRAGPISRRARPERVFSPYLDSLSSAFVAGWALRTADARKIPRMQISRLAIDDLSLVFGVLKADANANRRKCALGVLRRARLQP